MVGEKTIKRAGIFLTGEKYMKFKSMAIVVSLERGLFTYMVSRAASHTQGRKQ